MGDNFPVFSDVWDYGRDAIPFCERTYRELLERCVAAKKHTGVMKEYEILKILPDIREAAKREQISNVQRDALLKVLFTYPQ